MKKITAVIPIRKGSVRIKDKNIKPFGDTTLLEFKINTLKKSKLISEIIVNTDSDEAIKIAKKHNVGFHVREEYFASSECSANDYFEYLGKTTDSEYIAYTPVTAPFITLDTINACINMFDFHNPNDTIITGSLVKDFLFKKNTPLNFTLDKHPKSQDFNDIFAINFGVCLLSREKLLETRTILGNSPRIYQITDIEGVDIDNPLDFEYAEFLYSKVKNNY